MEMLNMNETNEQRDEATERKTNIRLAVAVGGLALGALALFYVSLFLIMILRPGLLFSIMPVPDIATTALSDGNRTYFLSQRPDMSNLSFKDRQQPEMQYFISPLEGTEPGRPQQVLPYSQAISGRGRILFLYQGGYRSYDGASFTEVSTEGIGQDPRGVMTPDGLYVLSTFEDGVHLYRITSGPPLPIPLPPELLSEESDTSCSCTRLVWSREGLALFWSNDDTINWTVWNGSAWTPLSTSPFEGGFQVVASDEAVYFFHRAGDGPDRSLSLSILANDAWTGPARLELPRGFMDWDVFVQQGKPMLLVRQFTNQTLYTIENSTLSEPIRLSGPFHPSKILSRMALMAIVPNLAVVLVILAFSTMINRYKNRFWAGDGVRHEFASLFRRFAAHLLDTLITVLPFVLAVVLFFRYYAAPSDNPFLAMLVIFIAVVFFFLTGYLYHSLFEGLYGATPGKRICGIMVLKADFTPCGLGAAFLRNIMRIVDSFFYYLVAAIALAGTMKWQRLGDLVADTVVVRRSDPEYQQIQQRRM